MVERRCEVSIDDEIQEYNERVNTFLRLEYQVELLEKEIGSKRFLITAYEIKKLLNGTICPTCWHKDIANLDGGAK